MGATLLSRANHLGRPTVRKDFQTDQGILQMRKKTRHFQAKTPQLTDKLQRMISDERQTVQAQVNQPQWLS